MLERNAPLACLSKEMMLLTKRGLVSKGDEWELTRAEKSHILLQVEDLASSSNDPFQENFDSVPLTIHYGQSNDLHRR